MWVASPVSTSCTRSPESGTWRMITLRVIGVAPEPGVGGEHELGAGDEARHVVRAVARGVLRAPDLGPRVRRARVGEVHLAVVDRRIGARQHREQERARRRHVDADAVRAQHRDRVGEIHVRETQEERSDRRSRDRPLEAPADVGRRERVTGRPEDVPAKLEDHVAARLHRPARREVGDDRAVGRQHRVGPGRRRGRAHELAGPVRQELRRGGVGRRGLVEVARAARRRGRRTCAGRRSASPSWSSCAVRRRTRRRRRR